MAIEFIGYVGHFHSSEIMRRKGPALDPAHVEAAAKLHEYVGFDRVLIAFNATSPESILVGQHISSVTEQLKLMIAHRPGFTSPTLAARQFATLDQFSRGRAAVHIIAGGNDAELAQDGDQLTKDERYARTSEYIDVLRREWTCDQPFDYDGRYYKVWKGFGDVKPVHSGGIPVFFGGASDAAIAVAGKHADIYALWGETYEQVSELADRVRAAAAIYNRSPEFSISLRTVLADTEEAAWAKADAILTRATQLRGGGSDGKAPHNRQRRQTGDVPPNEGSRRLLETAKKGRRLDKCLWTGIAALTAAQGSTMALVGTPDQVAEALAGYAGLGITRFLIRGFDPMIDTVQVGRELLPRVRQLLAGTEPIAVTA